jgi:hypothetical protein
MPDSAPREVYSAADLHEAHFIKSMLEESGIKAHIVGDHLQTAIGDLPAARIAPRIWVNAANFDQARKIITDHEAQRRSNPTPECEWTCTECGEPNEPSFEICWSCQASNGSHE